MRYASSYAVWLMLAVLPARAQQATGPDRASGSHSPGGIHIDYGLALRADTFLTTLRMSEYSRKAGSGTTACLLDSICLGRSGPPPCPRWPDTAAAWCQFVHVGGFFEPEGIFGFNRIMIGSTYVAALSKADEDPHLRVSNDGEHWQPFPGAPDPLFDTSDFTHPSDRQNADLLTDPDILIDSDGTVYQFNRPIFKGAGSRWSTGIFVSSSRDLVAWSRPVEVIHDTGQNLISPAPWVDPAGGFAMFTVDSVPGHPLFSGPGLRRGVRLWRAPRADSGWEVVDFVRAFGSEDTLMDGHGLPIGYNPYHIEVVDNGPGSKLVLLLCDSLGRAWTRQLYIGETTDNGRHLRIRQEPLLAALHYSPDQDTSKDQATGQWDRYVLYRATGWWAREGDEPVFELYYPGKSDSSNGYWVNKGVPSEAGAQYFVGRTQIHFPVEFMTIQPERVSSEEVEIEGQGGSTLLSLTDLGESAELPETSRYLWREQTTRVYGPVRGRNVHWFTIPDSMVVDSILMSDSSYDASSSDTAYPSIDSIIVLGPDRSSGTHEADSEYFRIHHAHHGKNHKGTMMRHHRWGLREWTTSGAAAYDGQKNFWGHLKPVLLGPGDKVAVTIVTRYNGNHNRDGDIYLYELQLKGRKLRPIIPKKVPPTEFSWRRRR